MWADITSYLITEILFSLIIWTKWLYTTHLWIKQPDIGYRPTWMWKCTQFSEVNLHLCDSHMNSHCCIAWKLISNPQGVNYTFPKQTWDHIWKFETSRPVLRIVHYWLTPVSIKRIFNHFNAATAMCYIGHKRVCSINSEVNQCTCRQTALNLRRTSLNIKIIRIVKLFPEF